MHYSGAHAAGVQPTLTRRTRSDSAVRSAGHPGSGTLPAPARTLGPLRDEGVSAFAPPPEGGAASLGEAAALPTDGPLRHARGGRATRLVACGLDLLLGRERRRRIRVQRTLLASATYGTVCAVQAYRIAQGLVDPRLGGLLIAVVALASLAFYLATRTGWSERFADPALTMPQMVFAMPMVAATYASGGPGRGALLTLVPVILMFGAFNLTRRQFTLVSVLGLLSFGSAMYAMSRLHPHVYSPTEEVVHFFFTATVLPAIALLAGQLSDLRERLRRQKADLTEALARIQELATHDELTGLNNRRHMQTLLEAEWRRCQRTAHGFAVCLVDLDHFKRLNDEHGHAAGDEALRLFAQEARRTLRDSDVVARWGGEEFLVLLSAARADEARCAVERLRSALAGHPRWQEQPHLRFTFSAGVAEYRAGEDVHHTIERADRALYAAKQAGRDRVACAPAA